MRCSKAHTRNLHTALLLACGGTLISSSAHVRRNRSTLIASLDLECPWRIASPGNSCRFSADARIEAVELLQLACRLEGSLLLCTGSFSTRPCTSCLWLYASKCLAELHVLMREERCRGEARSVQSAFTVLKTRTQKTSADRANSTYRPTGPALVLPPSPSGRAHKMLAGVIAPRAPAARQA